MKILSEQDLKKLKEKTNLNELTESEFKQYVYSKGYRDIEFFSDYFLPHRKQKLVPETKELVQIDTPDFHKELRAALDKGEDIDVIAPRGNAKTTAALIRVTHSILYKKVDSLIYIATAGLGEEGIGKIRYELETNQEILAIFGNMVPVTAENKIDKRLKKWRQKLLQLTNGTSVETISKKAPIRGKRPKKILIDDPQENKDVKNKRIVEEFNNWVFSALYNTLLPGGSMCVLGTVVGNLCLVKHLKDVKGWKTIQYQACDENFENILWPEMWSKEELIQRKQKIGTALFNQEFRNIPISTEDAIIKEYRIKYRSELPSSFSNIVMAIDPAISQKDSADFIGICITGFAENDKKFVLYSNQFKIGVGNELKNLVENLTQKYGVRSILIENVAFQDMLRQELALRNLPIKGIKPNSDKYTRLQSIAGQVEFGNVYFSKNDGELIYQLLNFPNIEHDDILDAFVYTIGTKFKTLVVGSL